MADLVEPHGGELKSLLLLGERRKTEIEGAKDLKRLVVSSKELSDLTMLGMGAFSPLDGFLCKQDYASVVKSMRLANGTLWPIPITLSVSEQEAADIGEGERIALYGPENSEPVATMLVEEIYRYDRMKEARDVYRTEDPAHPAVKRIVQQGDTCFGGPVRVLSEGGYPQRFPEYARPEETRAIFRAKEWRSVAAFQTRNPMHRSHEYITKIALEIVDGLFVHPIVGRLKEGDVPAEIRLRCYRALLENYYPQERVVMKVYPMEMRYGGPRETVLHAIIRQNFGCTHFIVGRDHAGVGNYYGPFDAHRIFDDLDPRDLAIEPLKMDWTFWCERCGQMASPRSCPHDEDSRLLISGTDLRRMLAEGKRPSAEFSRPEVLDILMDYYSEEQTGRDL